MENFRSVSPAPFRRRLSLSNKESFDSNAASESRHLVSPMGSPIPQEPKVFQDGDFCSCCNLLNKEKEESEKQTMQQLVSMRRVMTDLKVGHDKEVKELLRQIEMLKSEVITLQQKGPTSVNVEEGTNDCALSSEEINTKMKEQMYQQASLIKTLEESIAKVTESEAKILLELKTTKDSLEKSQERIQTLEKFKLVQEESIALTVTTESDVDENYEEPSDLSEAQQKLKKMHAAVINANNNSKIIEERSAKEILSLVEQREADQTRVEGLLAKIEAEVGVLREQHESDQKQIEELTNKNQMLEADLSKLKNEIQFKDDAIENAENILAYLEESKEGIEGKCKNEIAEKQRHISELLLIQDELKYEIQVQKNLYEEKLHHSQYTIEKLMKEQQERNFLEMLKASKKDKCVNPGKSLLDSASNITDYLFNCASLENINDDNMSLKKKRTS
jgi:hypothetical protein